MILEKGEKIHVIHRRFFDGDTRRHFLGVVDEYENGIVCATGYVFVMDKMQAKFVRKSDPRTRIISIASGDVLVNVVPASVDLESVIYEVGKGCLRVTDHKSKWHLDISGEFAGK